jgi:prepilin-type N-terminal cleavage/methylation domain-containing protein
VANQKDRVRSDGGFTMIEVLVALGLITTLMASLGTYFVSSMQVSRYQAQIQTAVRLAQAGMEMARGHGGPTLLAGRAACTATNCDDFTPYDTQGYLRNMARWDARGTGTLSVPLPTGTGETIPPINGITYYRYYFVGKCWSGVTGSTCLNDSTLPVAMVRLVVGVGWMGSSCPYTMCIRAATALFSAEPSDPVFEQ